MSNAVQLVLLIGGIAGAITAIAVLVKTCFSGLRRWIRLLEAIDNKTKELEHNGGSSMKDTIKKILETQAKDSARLERLEKRRFPFRR